MTSLRLEILTEHALRSVQRPVLRLLLPTGVGAVVSTTMHRRTMDMTVLALDPDSAAEPAGYETWYVTGGEA